MAKQVKVGKNREFSFASAGKQSKYPWETWFDGNLWLIEKGTDYDVETDMMPGKLKSAARRKYKVVQISKHDVEGARLPDALIIRARDMDDDERAAEDLQRLEDKAKNVERRERKKAEQNGQTPA